MEKYHKSKQFLQAARASAGATGYDPSKLFIATDDIHKLTYISPEGVKHFGRRGYGDFLYYKRFTPNLADFKRRIFRASHEQISKIHHLGKYSPNELAINILW
jgi:hypothetical protein